MAKALSWARQHFKQVLKGLSFPLSWPPAIWDFHNHWLTGKFHLPLNRWLQQILWRSLDDFHSCFLLTILLTASESRYECITYKFTSTEAMSTWIWTFLKQNIFYPHSCGWGLQSFWRVVSKQCGIDVRTFWFHVNGRPICEKRMRFQKYPDSCGCSLI